MLKNLEGFLLKLSKVFAQSKVLNTITSAFMMVLPFTLVGSIFSLLKGISIGDYQAWILSNGLYDLFGVVYQFTVGMLAIYIVFGIAYQYATKNGMKKSAITIGLTGILAFFIITPYTLPDSPFGAAYIPTSWLGATGMFMAITIGFLVGYIFKLCVDFKLEIRLPDEVPSSISKQFSAIIPVLLVSIFFLIVRWGFSLTSFGDAQSALYSVVKIPLGLASSTIFGLYFLTLFAMVMWFLGIHGGLVVMPITMLLFTSLQLENLAAFSTGSALPNWITGASISLGNGSLATVIAMLLFSKSKTNRSITNVAIIPALFGVDEPAYFGYPMILNPLFFVPWVIVAPILTVFGTYFLQMVHLLPFSTGVNLGMNTPFVLLNLAHYGWTGAIWSLVFMAIMVLVNYPFVKAYDKQCLAKEKEHETITQNEIE